MIPMIFIGIIMYYLGILQGWLLFWYIVGTVVVTIKDLGRFISEYDEYF